MWVYSCKKNDPDTLLRDMAIFDFNYSKAILQTKKIDKKTTLAETTSILNDWAIFKKRYYYFNKEDSQWKNDINEINDILIRSKYYAEKDIDITASHYILHDVKYILSEMRERNNLEWFTDYLSAIYKRCYRLNELSVLYSEKNELTEEEKNRIRSVYIMLDSQSQKFVKRLPYLDYTFFNFPENEKLKLQSEIRYIDALIRESETYISQGNYKNVSIATENILTLYFDILSLFASHSGKI